MIEINGRAIWLCVILYCLARFRPIQLHVLMNDLARLQVILCIVMLECVSYAFK